MPKTVRQVVDGLLRDPGVFSNRDVAAALGVSRQAVHKQLRALVEEGLIEPRGTGRAAGYRRAGSPFGRLQRDGLDEGALWEQASRAVPAIRRLHPEVRAIVGYAFTEMVNNAVDHSDARFVEVRFDLRPGRFAFEVEDDGVGIFDRVREALGLASVFEAVAELTKGKVTSDPKRHTGEGIFFVSKVADWFQIDSGGISWSVDNERADTAIGESHRDLGTKVRFELDPKTTRRLDAVFAEFTDDFEFSRSRTFVKLFQLGTRFVSRSEAKRLSRGLERFREVVLDFKGVVGVGQGFADELFRVWQVDHRRTVLTPVNMSAPVAFMVGRARRGAKPASTS